MKLKYDDKGLLTGVAQDIRSGQVLMVAMMNAEAVQRTMESGKAHFWSRSRQKLWLKGETSGNILDVMQVKVDCDGDALLLLVEARRTGLPYGQYQLFLQGIWTRNMLNKLFSVIEERRENPIEGSYTANLIQQGYEKVAQKVGEGRLVEVVIAGALQGRQRTIEESADLIYHLFVLLAQQGISLAEVETELEKRHIRMSSR